MVNLFIRTTSQGLQAFLPIAFGLAAFRRSGRTTAITAIRWGIGAAAIASVPAGWLLQRTLRQSLWEAALAAVSLGCVAWLIRPRTRARTVPPVVLAAITVLLVTRQTMEIDAVFVVAAFQLRSLDAIIAVCSAVSLAIALAALCVFSARRFSRRAWSAATRAFAILFASQLAMYAFHESAEAGVLPWSETLHLATEPYGPDGLYGRHVSWFLIALPLATATAITLRQQWRARVISGRPVSATRYAITACVAVILVGGALSLRSATTHTAAPADEVGAMANAPHLLFRHTSVDHEYNNLSMALLAEPSRRLSVGVPCERVAFAAERGICLQAARGVFTTYRAILFDRQFAPLASWSLAGSPSRTRVAPDGRVGAITVFVTGHGYGSALFSTKTTLIDMASGDALGDLEQFATWRGGTRIRAQDLNFWGVTFGRDSNRFYATLGTAGKTYLVRGDLGLRKLTVLYEGLECPSLSPDERLIVFKKRTSTVAGNWRLAVLDLVTMTERPMTSETRNIDDQVEWLDNEQVLYAIPRPGSPVADVWVARVNATVPARMFLPAAESPVVVRPSVGAGSHSAR